MTRATRSENCENESERPCRRAGGDVPRMPPAWWHGSAVTKRTGSPAKPSPPMAAGRPGEPGEPADRRLPTDPTFRGHGRTSRTLRQSLRASTGPKETHELIGRTANNVV